MAEQDQEQQPGSLGKQVAEQMRGKLDADEAHRLVKEDDKTYDAQVLAALETKLKAELTGFNDIAKAADQLTVEKGSGMLQVYKANLPVLAAMVQHRQVQLLPALQSTPVQTLAISGGPDEFTYGSHSQAEFIKSLLMMAVSGSGGLK